MIALVGYTGFVGSNIYEGSNGNIDKGYNSKNIEANELTFINLDQELNIAIPVISDNVLSDINSEITNLYSDILNFVCSSSDGNW